MPCEPSSRILRFALRILSGSPGFPAVAVYPPLAVGIGSATTVFSWIDSLLLSPYPGVSQSEQLAVLEMSIPSAPNGGTSVLLAGLHRLSRPPKAHLRSSTPQRYCSLSIGQSDAGRLAWGELVSASYFDVLGVQPILGRMFVAGGAVRMLLALIQSP